MSAPPARDGPRLPTLGAAMLGLLVIEFLLGMALALFLALPTGGPLTVLAASPLLWLHILVGFLLIGITANALRWTVGRTPRAAQAITALGFASAIGAFLAGMAFTFGDQSPGASYAMSVGFVGVLLDAGYLLARGAQLVGGPTGRILAAAPVEV
jgi:uncharacterized membrane protein